MRKTRAAQSLPVWAAALTVFMLGACGTETALPASAYGDGVDLSGPSERLAAMNRLDSRVNAVGYRLSLGNRELCPQTGFITGMLLHAESQYAEYLRPVARAEWNLTGDMPGVAAVAPDSPAAKAGLEVGDLLLAVDGTTFAQRDVNAAASYDGLATNTGLLNEALTDGRATLKLRRGGEELSVTVEGVQGCSYPWQMDPSADFDARADGKRIFISSAFVAFAGSDDDLAVVLGHELAHNVLEHREFFDEIGVARSVLGNWGVAPWHLVEAEREADRVGLYLMARAGYAPEQAGPFWRALALRQPQLTYAQWGHPSAGSRAEAVERTAEEIGWLQRAGLPLDPFRVENR